VLSTDLSLTSTWRWVTPRRTAHAIVYTAQETDSDLGIRAFDLVVAHTDGTVARSFRWMGNPIACSPTTLSVFTVNRRDSEIVRVSIVDGTSETIYSVASSERIFRLHFDDAAQILFFTSVDLTADRFFKSVRLVWIDLRNRETHVLPMPLHYFPSRHAERGSACSCFTPSSAPCLACQQLVVRTRAG
jgi:hypothetical protein